MSYLRLVVLSLVGDKEAHEPTAPTEVLSTLFSLCWGQLHLAPSVVVPNQVQAECCFHRRPALR